MYLSPRASATAGDCIGESFYSTERFPVIPPFGLPELTGILLLTPHHITCPQGLTDDETKQWNHSNPDTILGQDKVFVLKGCPPFVGVIHAKTYPRKRKGVLIRKGGLISVHVKLFFGKEMCEVSSF